MRAEHTVDLTNCDREPIQIPGAILPHGALLVVTPDDFVIEQVAGDTLGLMGLAAEDALGRPLHELLADDQMRRLRELSASSSLQKPRHLLDPVLRVLPVRPVDASVHMRDGCLVLEFEDADLADRFVADPLACVQDMLDGLNTASTLQDYCQTAAERVRAVAGYDRVMVYRFMPDDSGWVFAEDRRDDLTPFLDLHYPASDIPQQARALYLESWLRLITQVDYDPAPLIPQTNPRSGNPLDMSHAILRDVSPIHREYLRNMGVDASMSISVVCEGKLWGLIACHHYSPRRLPRHLRAVCELFGAIFSLQLEARQRADLFEARVASRNVLTQIMQQLANEDDYAVGLVNQSQNLLDYIEAGGLSLRVGQQKGGVAVRVNSGISTLGNTPDEDQISALTDWLTMHMRDGEGIFATDRMSDLWPEARAFSDVGSGVLAISVSREPRDFILWFRPETVQTVSWGGDPNKPVEIGPNGDRLTPRKSFEAWTETVRHRSTPWNISDNDAAFDLRVSLLEVVLRRIDAAARERLRAWEQERLLMAELDHRVKNTLANIQALVTQTSNSARSLADFTNGLNQRIRAMSRAHSLLTKSRWEGITLRDLLTEELKPYISKKNNVVLDGPSVSLDPKSALALSLAVHELTTNAAKYGALSDSEGRIAINWALDDRDLKIEWRERDGPEVVVPMSRGFGSTLIERALTMETGGTSQLVFDKAGVTCTITVPRIAIVRVDPDFVPASGIATDTKTSQLPSSRTRVLVVEDSALVVMLIEMVVEDLGWDLVGPATRVDQAVELARDEDVDLALLDINLNGAMSWDVARLLRERDVPFALTSGYDGDSVVIEKFSGQRMLNKPFDMQDLKREMQFLLEGTPRNRR